MTLLDWIKRKLRRGTLSPAYGVPVATVPSPALPVAVSAPQNALEALISLDCGMAGVFNNLETLGVTGLLIHTDTNGRPAVCMGTRVPADSLRVLAQWADARLAELAVPVRS